MFAQKESSETQVKILLIFNKELKIGDRKKNYSNAW